jgi:hypothetical protein
VQRWEQSEGLPVHRIVHEKRSTVFAYKQELDRWWRSRQATKSGRLIEPYAAVKEIEAAQPKKIRRYWLLVAIAAAVVASGILLAIRA